MKNILFVAHERKLGGATQSLITLVEILKTHGYNIEVIVPLRDCPVAKELKNRDIKIFPIFMPWWQMPREWNFVLKLLFRIFYRLENLQLEYCYRRLKYCHIDIVHSNSSVIDFGARLAEKLKCKHIWHFREFGDADYNLEPLVRKSLMWSRINEGSDRIVFISKCLMDYYKGYLDNRKSVLIYNGISSKYIIDRDYDSNRIVTFLISGNLHRGKGQLVVLRAARLLRERKVNNFQVLIAGAVSSMPDSYGYSLELKDYIKQNNLETTVKLLGKVEDMISLRKDANIEIVASRKEAFGRVTIEALLAGMPVIASDSGANPELICHKWNGLLFQTENEYQLAECMEYMIRNPEEIRRTGVNGQKWAKENFMAERNASMIEKLYESI